MGNINIKSITIKKDKTSIITSIVFLILGILLYLKDKEVITLITYIIGILFAVCGSIKLYKYYKEKDTVSNIDLTLGILLIIVGIIIMFCSSIIEQAIRIVIGGFIIANGINKLIIAINSKNNNKNWIILLLISILLIIGGLYTILKANLILKVIGIILIVYSSIDIMSYLTYPKNKNIMKNEDIIK